MIRKKNCRPNCCILYSSQSYLILACACASHFGLRISFWPAHAHLILLCACASHFGLRMRISFCSAHAHLILACACASHFGLRMRISFWPARAHLILLCACASHFGLRICISFSRYRFACANRFQVTDQKIFETVATKFCRTCPNYFIYFIIYFLSNVLLFENIQSIAQDSV